MTNKQTLKKHLDKLSIPITAENDTVITFQWNGEMVTVKPDNDYYHTGSTITDGKGLDHLLDQLKHTNKTI
jgi:hypothetical protein